MKYMQTIFWVLLLIFIGYKTYAQPNRGEVGVYQDKFIWTGTGEAFVPNYIMIDMLSINLTKITEKNLKGFIDEFIHGHGFNGVHVPVYGQWFHIGNTEVTISDSLPDQATFDKLKMIISMVYEAGGCTHLWAWGDDSRSQTAKSTKGGIMGKEEKRIMDEIAHQLGPLPGWTMGYGFDLFEWVNDEQLNQWHDYLWAKPGWSHLLGARSNKNELNQIYEGMDYSSYEIHKPWYPYLREMISKRPGKPTFSEDRYRIRHPSKYPEKDYNAEETLRGLWHHTMAGGIAAIWGNLDGDGIYENKEALKCFSVFWQDKNRFKKTMEADNSLASGYCLKAGNELYVYYQEDTNQLEYAFAGKSKKVVAVDTRKAYEEISLGVQGSGKYTFNAPYKSDWAIAAAN